MSLLKDSESLSKRIALYVMNDHEIGEDKKSHVQAQLAKAFDEYTAIVQARDSRSERAMEVGQRIFLELKTNGVNESSAAIMIDSLAHLAHKYASILLAGNIPDDQHYYAVTFEKISLPTKSKYLSLILPDNVAAIAASEKPKHDQATLQKLQRRSFKEKCMAIAANIINTVSFEIKGDPTEFSDTVHHVCDAYVRCFNDKLAESREANPDIMRKFIIRSAIQVGKADEDALAAHEENITKLRVFLPPVRAEEVALSILDNIGKAHRSTLDHSIYLHMRSRPSFAEMEQRREDEKFSTEKSGGIY